MAIRRDLSQCAAPFRSMSRLRENYFGTEEIEDLHALDRKRISSQDAQKVRPARPQRVKGRGVPSGYVEGLNDARTLLAGFFSILLFRYEDQHPRRALVGHVREPSCGIAGGKSREASSTADLNGAESVEGSLRRVEGENPRDLST
jgi:hypothetical protein